MNSNQIARIVELRDSDRLDEALALALEAHEASPDDPEVALQCAWTYDRLGLETEAVPFYEAAIEGDLDPVDLRHALLGLGSTYRALGHYEASLSTLSRGVEQFPDDRGLQVFQALALYNNGQHKKATELLLRLLIDTTADPEITAYKGALEEYAPDLDRTWS